MCFIGFITKLVIAFMAFKWYHHYKRNKAGYIKDKDSDSCKWAQRRTGPLGRNGGLIIQFKHEGVRTFLENAIDRFNLRDYVNVQNVNGETTISKAFSISNTNVNDTNTVTTTTTTSTHTQIEEQPTKYVISIDVPGLRQEDLQVTVLDDVRKVIVRAGVSSTASSSTAGTSSSSEPSISTSATPSNNVRAVDVCISLPRAVELSSIKGDLNLGVLSLTVDRTLAEGRRVVINSGNGSTSTSGSGDDGWEKAAL
ncbi:hypothetical protein HDU76_005221 [Blyttiomyces sp. JEL0837]|nr:hypothetical protein HDU76_005221 [Blyttiomyces sp. JEL0837]